MGEAGWIAGYPVWGETREDLDIRFVGRGPRGGRVAVLEAIAGRDGPLASLRQTHSNRVLDAAPGECGDGDALVTGHTGLALSVASADCVPVLLASPGAVAAVHAGWRGIVSGIVPAALARLTERPRTVTAWVGPAIGPCCYEVGPEVASLIAAASTPEVIGGSHTPHADLPLAVRHQLRSAGVRDTRQVGPCTACDRERLWSYRRDGGSAGRNLAFIWRREAPAGGRVGDRR